MKFAYLSSEWAKSSYHCGVTYLAYQRQHKAQLTKEKNIGFSKTSNERDISSIFVLEVRIFVMSYLLINFGRVVRLAILTCNIFSVVKGIAKYAESVYIFTERKKQTFQFFGAFVSIVVVLFEGPYRWCLRKISNGKSPTI